MFPLSIIGLGDGQHEERIPEVVMSEFMKRDGSVQTVSERVMRTEKALFAIAKALSSQNNRQGELFSVYLENIEVDSYPVLTSTNMIMIKYRDYIQIGGRFLYLFKDFSSFLIFVLGIFVAFAQIIVLLKITQENMGPGVCGNLNPPKHIWLAAFLCSLYAANVTTNSFFDRCPNDVIVNFLSIIPMWCRTKAHKKLLHKKSQRNLMEQAEAEKHLIEVYKTLGMDDVESGTPKSENLGGGSDQTVDSSMAQGNAVDASSEVKVETQLASSTNLSEAAHDRQQEQKNSEAVGTATATATATDNKDVEISSGKPVPDGESTTTPPPRPSLLMPNSKAPPASTTKSRRTTRSRLDSLREDVETNVKRLNDYVHDQVNSSEFQRNYTVVEAILLFMLTFFFQLVNVFLIVTVGITMATATSFTSLVSNFISIEVLIRVPEVIPQVLKLKDRSPHRYNRGFFSEDFKLHPKTMQNTRFAVYAFFIIAIDVTYGAVLSWCMFQKSTNGKAVFMRSEA